MSFLNNQQINQQMNQLNNNQQMNQVVNQQNNQQMNQLNNLQLGNQVQVQDNLKDNIKSVGELTTKHFSSQVSTKWSINRTIIKFQIKWTTNKTTFNKTKPSRELSHETVLSTSIMNYYFSFSFNSSFFLNSFFLLLLNLKFLESNLISGFYSTTILAMEWMEIFLNIGISSLQISQTGSVFIFSFTFT